MTFTGADIVNTAEKYSGAPYFEGNPQDRQHGFDCSGIVQRVMADLGVEIPRTTSYQLLAANSGGAGKNIGTDLSQALQGDILHYTGHEEIWIGGGKVFSEATNGTVAGVRNRTPWPIIGIIRYATGGPGPRVGSYGQIAPGEHTSGNSPQPPGNETDPGQVKDVTIADMIPGLTSVIGALAAIVKLFTFALDPKNWWRVALSIFGVILIIIALMRMTQTNPVASLSSVKGMVK